MLCWQTRRYQNKPLKGAERSNHAWQGPYPRTGRSRRPPRSVSRSEGRSWCICRSVLCRTPWSSTQEAVAQTSSCAQHTTPRSSTGASTSTSNAPCQPAAHMQCRTTIEARKWGISRHTQWKHDNSADLSPIYVLLLPLVWLFPLIKGSMGAAWR